MSYRQGIRKSFERIVDEKLKRKARKAITRPEFSGRQPLPSGAQPGDAYEQAGVTGLRANGNQYLTGDVTINGAKGVTSNQTGQEIQIASPKILYCPNARTPLSQAISAPLSRNTIYLFPIELPGYILLREIFVVAEKNGTPDDNLRMMELGLYRRNEADDGFIKEVGVGPVSYDQTNAYGGNVRRVVLETVAEVGAGQRFIAFLYTYAGPAEYRFGVCQALNQAFPGAGKFLAGRAISLPNQILDADLSMLTDALPWLELRGSDL